MSLSHCHLSAPVCPGATGNKRLWARFRELLADSRWWYTSCSCASDMTPRMWLLVLFSFTALLVIQLADHDRSAVVDEPIAQAQ